VATGLSERLCAQFIEQRLAVLQVGGVEALGEPRLIALVARRGEPPLAPWLVPNYFHSQNLVFAFPSGSTQSFKHHRDGSVTSAAWRS
jgi:hypothetical protein